MNNGVGVYHLPLQNVTQIESMSFLFLFQVISDFVLQVLGLSVNLEHVEIFGSC